MAKAPVLAGLNVTGLPPVYETLSEPNISLPKHTCWSCSTDMLITDNSPPNIAAEHLAEK